MALKVRPALFLFNRGMVSPLALGRVTSADNAASRVRLSAETQTNWMPRTLGSMMLRPGGKYTGQTYQNNKPYFIPFLKATDDLADIEFTDAAMRVWVDDEVIDRENVSTVIANTGFDADVASWINANESGTQSDWETGGYMYLKGTNFNAAKRQQSITVAGADENVQHGLRVKIARGVVTLRVGSTVGGAEYFERTLYEGEYSLAFTPTGSFEIELSANTKYKSLVDSIEIESSGDMVLTSPYAEADIGKIRFEQSVDVVFLACDGYPQYKVERYGTRSWALVKYLTEDGPYRNPNLSKTTLTPSAVSGDITLVASNDVFTADNVGSLYRIGSIGQFVEVSANGANQFSDEISVSGTDTTRDIAVEITGTWSGTVTLQRSSDEGTTWAEVKTYTANTTETYNDELDNQDLMYRIGVATGDYTSGTVEASLNYTTGSLTGHVRITEVTDAQNASAIVLSELGGTDASNDWSEGQWSERRGFPTVVIVYESRMSWFGRSSAQLSESDAYTDYDQDTIGDAGPINRTIGFGPVDVVNWAHSGARLLLGADGLEIVTRQSYDEIMSPENSGFIRSTRLGSARADKAVIDDMPVFIQRCGTKLYKLMYDSLSYKYDYKDLMELYPEIGQPGLSMVAVQRQPDTRIHALRSDGKVIILVSEPAEDVSALILYETDGIVEDIYVQPGSEEDAVYYIVKRTINGQTVRYREKWALETECQGGTKNKQADSFVEFTSNGSATLSGLDHLEGEEVIVWADGKDYSAGYGASQTTYTVTGGEITLSESVDDAIVGLPYTAQYKSVKLAYGANKGGTALGQVKRIDHIGPILYNTHHLGLRYGKDFDNLANLPSTYKEAPVADDTIFDEYDGVPFHFDGEYDTDSRMCLEAQAPRPCTILAVPFGMQTYEQG